MNQELALTEDEKRLELEACEAKIFSAFRRGLEATCDIGKELRKIDARRLYEVRGYDDILPYAKRELRMDEGAVTRSMDILTVIELLEKAGAPLPSNESQLVELARLPETRVVEVWERLVDTCDKEDVPITTKRIRVAVNLDDDQPPARKGVAVSLDDIEPEALSEAGERALARIARVCGLEVAEAIRTGVRTVSERAMIKWAEQKDHEMRGLVYYVIDQGWSVGDALVYESKTVNGNSTLDQMAMRARARGGHLAIRHEEFLVKLDRNPVDAAA